MPTCSLNVTAFSAKNLPEVITVVLRYLDHFTPVGVVRHTPDTFLSLYLGSKPTRQLAVSRRAARMLVLRGFFRSMTAVNVFYDCCEEAESDVPLRAAT